MATVVRERGARLFDDYVSGDEQIESGRKQVKRRRFVTFAPTTESIDNDDSQSRCLSEPDASLLFGHSVRQRINSNRDSALYSTRSDEHWSSSFFLRPTFASRIDAPAAATEKSTQLRSLLTVAEMEAATCLHALDGQLEDVSERSKAVENRGRGEHESALLRI